MSEIKETSPIYNLKIYKEITPTLLVSLGTFYITALLFRYLKWRYRKRKAKKMRIDRRKLENFWRKRSVYLNSRVQKPTQIYDSNATLVNVQEKSIQSRYRELNKFDMRKKKRQQLLWQWSVSMGYCRYNHAYHLDLLIDRLLEHDSGS